MSDEIKITYVNRSLSQDPPKIILFHKNEIPTFNVMRDGVVWRVIKNVGRGSIFRLSYPTETAVSASWNDHTCQTAKLYPTIGKRYCVVEDKAGMNRPRFSNVFIEKRGRSCV